jgi:hypothetical protein
MNTEPVEGREVEGVIETPTPVLSDGDLTMLKLAIRRKYDVPSTANVALVALTPLGPVDQ